MMEHHSYGHLIRIIGKKRQNILLYQQCSNTFVIKTEGSVKLNFEKKNPGMYNHDHLVIIV